MNFLEFDPTDLEKDAALEAEFGNSIIPGETASGIEDEEIIDALTIEQGADTDTEPDASTLSLRNYE